MTVSLLCCGLVVVPDWVYGLFSPVYCVLKNLKNCIFCFCLFVGGCFYRM